MNTADPHEDPGDWTTLAQLPIRRIEVVAERLPRSDHWPMTIPAVAQLCAAGGLDLAPVTVLVGENGSGKSTLVEAIAMAYGLNAEGGSTFARHRTRESESQLYRALRVVRGHGSRWGFFLRSETMHGLYSYLDERLSPRDPGSFHEVSHGESFLQILGTRFDSPGFYVLDEPESALSFGNCLGLVGLLHELAATGTSQVLVATHSPVVAVVPGARILELDAEGWHEAAWEDLELVAHYRRFLDDPRRYLRHLIPPS